MQLIIVYEYMETHNEFDLNKFLLRHAIWIKETQSQEKAEFFIKETLKEHPKDRRKLLFLIRKV